ncbi:fungal hydrophobin [Mycena pura]|uniref:Hydrophobin n=1 Tax=Mycena pura TaxID=153505 RepID=A0AAD6Y298_9AGAR|nr:fungal hydrophobin [Mycena pura]
MFPKVAVFATALLATLAVAAPGGSPPPAAPGTTNVCCTSVLTQSDPLTTLLTGLLGINLDGILGSVGLGCTLLSVLGNTCSNTAVNCQSTQVGGLINIGCIPITL